MSLFVEFSIILVIAAGMSVLMRILKQPLIIGHIITGLIVGPFVFSVAHSTETLELFSHLGIAFLLFVVGIHLSPSVIRKFGMVSVVTGIGQVALTTGAGWLIARMLGFSTVTALYIAVALAFSSTIIILKLISDRGELDTLYANISIGFLLVQDLLAIGILFVIPMLAAGETSTLKVASMAGTGVMLVVLILVIANLLLPLIDNFVSRSLEMLLLFSVAWGMGVAAIFYMCGFAIESGALIAGIGLSRLQSRFEISSRLTPLRDFFLVLFFIVLGSQMELASVADVIVPAIILSVLVLVGNPIILMGLLGFMGYRKKTSLKTGFTVAQISEFSLILIVLGVRVGHVEESVLTLVTLVALITISGSSYLIMNADALYRRLSPYLKIFERTDTSEKRRRKNKYEVIVFGCNRLGYNFFEEYKELKQRLLVVDHDPDVVKRLQEHGVSCEFGDAGDIDFLESINLRDANLIVSTIPDAESNYLINKAVVMQESRAFVVIAAQDAEDALSHYNNGAGYVIEPQVLGGEYAVKIVNRLTRGNASHENARKRHIRRLTRRVA